MTDENNFIGGIEQEILQNPNFIQVRYKDGSFKGNTFVAGNRYVSAWHVVSESDWELKNIQDSSLQPHLKQIGEKDLAMSDEIQTITGFSVAETYNDDDEVEVKGYDGNGKPYSIKGKLESLGPIYGDQMQITFDIKKPFMPGMSGSAVFNSRGEVVGAGVAGRAFDKCLMEPLESTKYIGVKPWLRPYE